MKNVLILSVALLASGACTRKERANLRVGPESGAAKLSGLAIPSSGYELLYEDHFTGTGSFNTADWYARPGDYNGNPNLASNVHVGPDSAGNSNLNIDFKYDGTVYSGGGIISKHLFGYGYYEVRAKLYGATKGLHQSFWSFGLNNGYNDPYTKDSLPVHNQVIEIDGFEVDSRTYNNLYSNFHAYVPTHSQVGQQMHLINTSNWFVMGYEWTPGQVKFYLNDSLVRTMPLTGNYNNYAAQNVWITALAGYAITGAVVAPTADAKMQVDYFRFYGKKQPGVNLIGNPSFEYIRNYQIPMSWREKGFSAVHNIDASFVDSTDHYGTTGNKCLKHYSTANYATTTRQKLEYIPNGYYRLTAWTKSSGGQAKCRMEASQFGVSDRYIDIPVASSWTQVTIDSILVSSNRMVVGFTSGGAAGQWLLADEMKLEAL